MRPHISIGYAFLLLFLSNGLMAKENIEVLAIDYPPYTSSEVSGNGISFRLLEQHLRSVDALVITPRFLPPARVQKKIQSGDWCFSFYPVSLDQGKVQFVALADRMVKIGLYHRVDDPLIAWTELEQLRGYRVALLRSDRSSDLYVRFVASGLIPVFVESVEQGLKMLQMKRIDAALGDEYMTDFVHQGLKSTSNIRFAKTSLFETPIGLFVNQNCRQSKLFSAN